MASIEFLNKRITGKEKEVEKLQKKMDRIHKAEATNWEINPYYYNEYDLTRTQRDLDAAQKALDGYKADLAKETEKANSRNIKPILDFLEAWKEHVRKYYEDSFPRYLAARAEYYEADKAYCDWYNSLARRKAPVEEQKARRKKHDETRKAFYAAWIYIEQYVIRRGGEDALDTDRIRKDLDREADVKYDDIIERTNRITGTITDASGLSIGGKGDLNGYIIGERGTAKVTTIGAGGYNIQCYHFRTLIHEEKRP